MIANAKIIKPGIIRIKCEALLKNKKYIVERMIASGVPINANYIQIAPLWPWLKTDMSLELEKISKKWSERHIILYLHEGYKDWYVKYLLQQIIKACIQHPTEGDKKDGQH